MRRSELTKVKHGCSSRQAGTKARIFYKVGAQIRLGQHLSILFSLSLLLNLLRESIIEKVFALAMCMQLSGVMSISGDLHFREMIVGCFTSSGITQGMEDLPLAAWIMPNTHCVDNSC